ncbi:MAG: right-handed parallel beta-helix repeat-containing protein, partial [Thermoplasmata archaeon]|nr:right-handed parallel beta-helix repeat-containing protein [Thermoplasmata archaeon]
STAIKCNETSAPTITNNDILVYSDGIGISTHEASPTIFQNDITVEENCVGVFVDGDSVASIEDNKIYGLPIGDSKYGIEFDNNAGIAKSKANNNTIENFSYGIRCFESSDIDIENNPIKNIVEYGVYVLDSYSVKVSQIGLTDNLVMIENSSGMTLSLINSNATVLNSSLGQKSVDKDSQLTVMWYLHLKVTDSLDAPIEGASVTIYNSSNVERHELVTPSNGFRNWIRCIEYIQEDRDSDGVSEQNPDTPHTIIAEKGGLHPGSLVTDISASKTEILVLQPNQLPSTPSGLAPLETHNLTPNITWLPGSDPDNDILTYHISIWEGESSTTGDLTVDDNTTKLSYFNLTPKLQYGGGNNTYYLELQSEDDYAGVSGIISHKFYIVNHPPTIGNLSDKSVYAGEVLWFNVTASDPDTDPVDILVFSEDSAKFEIDPDTGEVYWVTTKNDIGVYEVEFKLEDGNGGVATKIINITVLSLNLHPIPDAGEDLTVIVNSTVTLNGSGSFDNDGIIIGYEWECISYNVPFENANSSAPSFTPTVDGKYIIHLRVMDDNLTWSTVYDVVNITVEIPMKPEPKNNSAPVLKNGSVEPSEGTDQINYTFTVEYYDEDNDAPDDGGYVRLFIGSSIFTLNQEDPSDTDYTDGALFTITLDAVLLGTGNHTFRFEAYDGEKLAVGDIDGHSGPTISPYKPTSQDKDDNKEDQLSDLFWLLVLIAIIILIVVIVIIAAVLHLKKRDREAYLAEEPYDD